MKIDSKGARDPAKKKFAPDPDWHCVQFYFWTSTWTWNLQNAGRQPSFQSYVLSSGVLLPKVAATNSQLGSSCTRRSYVFEFSSKMHRVSLPEGGSKILKPKISVFSSKNSESWPVGTNSTFNPQPRDAMRHKTHSPNSLPPHPLSHDASCLPTIGSWTIIDNHSQSFTTFEHDELLTVS